MKSVKDLKKYFNDEEFKKLNDGEKRLVRFYYNTIGRTNQIIDDDIILFDDIVWDEELEGLGNMLKEYNVNKIIFNSTWSRSVEFLMYLLELGYEVESTIVYHKEKWFDDKYEIKKGIKLVRGE